MPERVLGLLLPRCYTSSSSPIVLDTLAQVVSLCYFPTATPLSDFFFDFLFTFPNLSTQNFPKNPSFTLIYRVQRRAQTFARPVVPYRSLLRECMPRVRWFVRTRVVPDRRTPTARDPTTLSAHIFRSFYIEHPALGEQPVQFLREVIEYNVIPTPGFRQHTILEANLHIIRFFLRIFPVPTAGG